MSPEPDMTLLKLPDKLDQLKHFQRHCAFVKLLALLLIVLRDWGAVALAVGLPFLFYVGYGRHWPLT
jgi:hypothetical protein